MIGETRSPLIRYLLGGLLAFGALNAVAGGYYGLSGAEGVPREQNSKSLGGNQR